MGEGEQVPKWPRVKLHDFALQVFMIRTVLSPSRANGNQE
jgi:hypothetical protein